VTRGTRVLLTVVLLGAVLFLTTVGAGAAAVYHGGSVAVEIDDDGQRFHLKLPAALISAAITLTPGSVLDDATAELRPFLPAVEAGWRELLAAPDFVLVEVESAAEHVRVEKRGSRLEVLVDCDDGRVRVGLPLRTVGSLVRKLS